MVGVSNTSRVSPGTSVLAVIGLILSGCAYVSDNTAEVLFSNPAQFDLMDCKQIDASRKWLAAQSAEIQGLMAKAETGAAGSVVVEVAYRNDYLKIRGQAMRAEEAWQREKCGGAANSGAVAAHATIASKSVAPDTPIKPVPSASTIY